MKILPNKNRVLVRLIDEENKSKGGIILPDAAKQKSQIGEVIAAHADNEFYHKGDVVLCPLYLGIDVTLDGVELKCLKEDEVLAKLESEVS